MSDVDPVLRCDSCQKLVRVKETIHKLGCCDSCGNRRFKSITLLNDQERRQIMNWGFPDLADQFKEVEGLDE